MAVTLVSMSCARFSGQVYLYGEAHGQAKILDREFAIWSGYYREQGMRHLFVELPYFTGEFLNIWMKATDDSLLKAVYGDWQGTSGGSPLTLDFYRRIKRECPQTVFHGTDIGHQHETTGQRYLRYLEGSQLKDSDQYRLAVEAIAQGKRYYAQIDDQYREDTMAANFKRELATVGGTDIMGIYGSAHTGLDSLNYRGTGPSMANQLKAAYGAAIHAEDLSPLAKDIEPLRVDALTLGGKTYRALYFGKQDLKGFKNYDYREFWRLEGAYTDFKDRPSNGSVLPYDNYPMTVTTGQVFVIDLTDMAGAVTRLYFLSSGAEWQGKPATQEFELDS